MEISEQDLSSLIAVAKTHGIRAEARQQAKAAKKDHEAAEKDARQFGGYADCGDSYIAALDGAKGAFDAAVSREIASEKAYKKARLTAIESSPAIEPLIERFVLSTGTFPTGPN